jgi:hypothetical protein
MFIHDGGRITCFMSFHVPKITQKVPPPISMKQPPTLYIAKHETIHHTEMDSHGVGGYAHGHP